MVCFSFPWGCGIVPSGNISWRICHDHFQHPQDTSRLLDHTTHPLWNVCSDHSYALCWGIRRWGLVMTFFLLYRFEQDWKCVVVTSFLLNAQQKMLWAVCCTNREAEIRHLWILKILTTYVSLDKTCVLLHAVCSFKALASSLNACDIQHVFMMLNRFVGGPSKEQCSLDMHGIRCFLCIQPW